LKFSTRTLYGLKAILVLAQRYGEGSMSVSQIAKKEGISIPYLEQILNGLKKRGLVKSVRGPQGGYVLAQKPGELSLESLFYALEPKKAVDGAGSAPMAELDESAIGSRLFWQKLGSSIETGLSQSTLKDLVDEARRLKKTKQRTPAATFHI
jgi:Rrf2 family transcriptional regulator, cysteine metabolism repressor